MPGLSYLIDFENVHDGGLAGIENLNEEDCVYLFFTDNANKLSLDYLADIRVPLVVKKVASGKQSLDMHLVSFLGYLIGCEPPEGRQYAIISHDSDFDGICQFWCSQYGDAYKITRQPSIAWGQEAYDDSVDAMSDSKWVDPYLLEQLGELIRKAIRQHGQKNRNNTYSVLLSQLCTALSGSTAYQECRRQSGLKAQHMLEKYFASIVTIQTKDSSILVYDVPNMYLLNKQKQAEMSQNQQIEEPKAVEETEFVETGFGAENELMETSQPEEVFDLESATPFEYCAADGHADIEAASDEDQLGENPVEDNENLQNHPDPVDTKELKISIISECMLAKGIEPENVSDIADWIALLISDRTGKRAIYQAVLTRYGLKQGLELYAKIRVALENVDIPGGNCFIKKRVA